MDFCCCWWRWRWTDDDDDVKDDDDVGNDKDDDDEEEDDKNVAFNYRSSSGDYGVGAAAAGAVGKMKKTVLKARPSSLV